MSKLYKQPGAAPTRKVMAGGIGGGAATILIYIGSLFGLDLPAEVAAELGAMLATIVSLLMAYFAHDKLPPANPNIVK